MPSFADRVKNAYFHATVAFLPFPQSCPALVTPKSPEVAAALVVKVWGAGGLVPGSRCLGRAAVPEERGPNPHLRLVNFQASSPTAGEAPEGCHVCRAGEGLGRAGVPAAGTRASSRAGEKPASLPAPAWRTSPPPSPTWRPDSSTSQKKKTGNGGAEGKKGLACPQVPLLEAGSLRDPGWGATPPPEGFARFVTPPVRVHGPVSPLCGRLSRGGAAKALLLRAWRCPSPGSHLLA